MPLTNPARIATLACTLLILAGCFFPARQRISSQIIPEQATITHWDAFPNSGSVRIAHMPEDRLALYSHSTGADKARRLTAFDDTLGLLWSNVLTPYKEDELLLWLGYHSDHLITVTQRRHRNDSIAIWAESVDPRNGNLKTVAALGVHSMGKRNRELRVFLPRVLTSPDSSRLVSYTVDRYPRMAGEYDSLLIHAHMIDAQMQQRGSITVSLPILEVDTHRDFPQRILDPPIIDSLGRIYQALVMGPSSVRVHRLDIEKGSVSALDITTPPMIEADDRNVMGDLVMQVGANNHITVAVSDKLDDEISGVTLYRLDFDKESVDISRRIDLAAEIPSHPDSEEMFEQLQLRSIRPAGDHGSILLLEETMTYVTYGRSRSYIPGTIGHETYSSVAYGNRHLAMMMVDDTGTPRWTSIDERPHLYRTNRSYWPDLWRFDGDTLHYLTRGVSYRRINLRNGGMAPPRQLISSTLNVDYTLGRWLDRRRGVLLLGREDYHSIVAFRF